MITTVSITPCWKSILRPRPERLLARLRGIGWAAVVSVLILLAGPVHANEIASLRVERAPGGVLLSAQVRFEVPPAVDDALQKGIPMFFVIDAVLLRDRWYWTAQEVAGATRHLRLSYQPLTRRWRVVSANNPIGHTGLALGQTFDTRDEAIAVVQRISGWKIADASEVEPDQRYSVALRFRLDVSQLPRPFQIGVVGQAEWNLAAVRTQRLEPAK